jgi:hypothetical protein
MHRRRLLKATVISPVVVLLGTPALASNVLETKTFVFTLPDGWVRDLHTDPVSARGPNGELLEISSSRISGPPGDSPELARIRANVEASGVRTLRLGESEPGLTVERPITRAVLIDDVVLNEVVYHARDTGWKIAQFSVTGPRTAVFISLRVPGGRVASIGAVRAAITRIQWVAQ